MLDLCKKSAFFDFALAHPEGRAILRSRLRNVAFRDLSQSNMGVLFRVGKNCRVLYLAVFLSFSGETARSEMSGAGSGR